MPNIVGPLTPISTSMSIIEAHLSHLLYLSNSEAASRVLIECFNMTKRQAKEVGLKMSTHISQGIEFYRQSIDAPNRVRPVLQYYSYLNFAVACILAYQPQGNQGYKSHGVEDKSYNLNRLDLSSILVLMRKGAIPLFHSIISDETLYNQKFRFNELAAAIPLLTHELRAVFKMNIQEITINESIINRNGKWLSHVKFECKDTFTSKEARLTSSKIERAMPALQYEYLKEDVSSKNRLSYKSRTEWSSEVTARTWHQKKCMKLINFGGHRFVEIFLMNQRIDCMYSWSSVSRKRLIPTLTAALLLSFGLSSIARYRPILWKNIEDSELNMLINVFIHESDGMLIPTFRNLLFREEMCISQLSAL